MQTQKTIVLSCGVVEITTPTQREKQKKKEGLVYFVLVDFARHFRHDFRKRVVRFVLYKNKVAFRAQYFAEARHNT